MADNASITILRNTQANINAEPIKDGNILFTTDQDINVIYTDVGTKRIKIGGTVPIDSTITANSVNPVTSKAIFDMYQNLQVGGRNLITDSKGEFSGKYPNSGYTSLVTYSVNLPAYATQFVLSFEAKSTVAGDIIQSFFYNPSNIIRAVNSDGIVSVSSDGNISTTLTTDWKRYWVKWTAPTANTRSIIPVRLQKDDGTGTVSIRNIKFETGNTPTDWTPALEDMFDIVRPVGSLYSTTDANFNPNTATGWHGTWERIKDCVIYAAGDSDTVGSIVGSNTHTLTQAELPKHTHSIPELSGTAQSNGNHTHYSANGWHTVSGQQHEVKCLSLEYFPQDEPSQNVTSTGGAHTHSVTTNASTTGSQGSGTAIDMRPRRLNSIVWKRVS